MAKLPIVSGLLLSLSFVTAYAGTTYPIKHGSLLAGESVKIEEAGSKLFFPASVGGTLGPVDNGPFVSTDSVDGDQCLG